MYYVKFIVALCIVIPFSINGQDTIGRPGVLLSQSTFNYLFNKSFSKFMTGQQNGGSLSNYASFDPTESKFLLNGFIGLKDSTNKKPQYLSFSLSGSLINGNATTLFSNTKLNTDVIIDLKYHFLFQNKSVNYFQSERKKLELKKQDIREISSRDLENYEMSAYKPHLENQKNALTWKQTQLKLETRDLENKFGILKDSVDTLRSRNQISSPSFKTFSDSAQSLIKKINESLAEQYTIAKNIDSLNRSINRNDSLLAQYKRSLLKSTNEKIRSVELEANLNAIRYSWITVVASFNKRKYYTYYDSLSFENRLTKNTLDGFNLGLEWNFLHQGLRVNRSHYLNVGLVNRRYNNLDNLSPTDIEQEIETSRNDTTRTIGKKYSAFTDLVEDFRSWSFYSNYYFFFGKSLSTGIHLFPEFEFRNNKTNLINTGVGFIVALKNKKDDKNYLNIESYTRFIDMTNQLITENKFYERLEIGVRVGLPIKPF